MSLSIGRIWKKSFLPFYAEQIVEYFNPQSPSDAVRKQKNLF